MSSRSFTRKDFLVLTASAVAASTLAACGEDTPDPAGGSGAGTGGNGTSGSGTSGASGTPTTGGSSAGTGTTAGSGGASGGSGGGSSGGGGVSGGTGGASGGSGGASAGSGGGGGGMCNGDVMATSSGENHTHTLVVLAADIATGAEKVYETSKNVGAQGHTHWVKITAADFTALKAGTEVKKKSCSGGDHEYVLKCGAGASAPMAPTCNGDGDNCGKAMDMTCT